MRFYLLLLPLFYVQFAQGQAKNNGRTTQVEQLQQMKQSVSRKIDSLQVQLPELAANIDNIQRKINQLKKETGNQDKPDADSKQQISKLSAALATANNEANTLRKKFDTCFNTLDKSLSLQKDLEEKINALLKEGNL